MNRKITWSVLAILIFSLSAAAKPLQSDLLTGVSPGPDGKIDVLTVFPHQDDETIFVGGTILKMKKDPRVRVHILCMTLGGKSGAIRELKFSEDLQGIIRSAELRSAATVLGADEVIQGHYPDQGLSGLDPAALAKEVLSYIVQTHAEIVITYGPDGMTGHPDHIALSKATAAAFKQSPAKRLYYATLPRSLYLAYYAIGGRHPVPPTVRVDVHAEARLKDLAMHEHATQRHFSGVAPGMEMENLIHYEWFALAAENP